MDGAAAKKLLTTGTPGSHVAPFGVWSGQRDGPFAVTFRYEEQQFRRHDLACANIRWYVETSGFHEVRPVIVLPDGTMLVADLPFSSIPDADTERIFLLGLRWLKLDKDRVALLAETPRRPTKSWYPIPI